METICISLGGNIISRRNGISVSFVKKLHSLLKDYQNRYKFVITVGGGYTTRLYINSSREIIKNKEILDEIAIAITRINAMIVKDMLTGLDVYPNIATSLEELRMANKSSNVVVLGGLLPGMSTDAVCALACEVTSGKFLINVSKEGYIYDRNPAEKNAKRMERLNHNELISIASRFDTREPGSNFLFDLVACKIAKRSNTEVRFVNDDVNQLRLAILNKRHNGTTVVN